MSFGLMQLGERNHRHQHQLQQIATSDSDVSLCRLAGYVSKSLLVCCLLKSSYVHTRLVRAPATRQFIAFAIEVFIYTQNQHLSKSMAAMSRLLRPTLSRSVRFDGLFGEHMRSISMPLLASSSLSWLCVVVVRVTLFPPILGNGEPAPWSN